MREKVDSVDAKVEIVNAQVGAMDSKLDFIIKSIFDVTYASPSIQNQEQ